MGTALSAVTSAAASVTSVTAPQPANLTKSSGGGSAGGGNAGGSGLGGIGSGSGGSGSGGSVVSAATSAVAPVVSTVTGPVAPATGALAPAVTRTVSSPRNHVSWISRTPSIRYAGLPQLWASSARRWLFELLRLPSTTTTMVRPFRVAAAARQYPAAPV